MDPPPNKRFKASHGGRGRGRGGRGRGRGGGDRGGRDRNDQEENAPRVFKERIPWEQICESVMTLPLPEGTFPVEADFGVRAFLDPDRKPFQALFKQRFSDFLVREVGMDGTVVTLQSMDKLPERDVLVIEESKKTYDQQEGIAVFQSLVGEDVTTQLFEFSNDTARKKEIFLVEISDVDKSKRTEFHTAVRKYLPGLRSETHVEGDKRGIKVFFPGAQKRDRLWETWPKEKPSYCKFVLYKENYDTTVALEAVATAIGCGSKCFNFAGTKDKRAITTQWVTAYKVPAPRLQTINAKFDGIKVGNFSYVDKSLSLGDLNGNHFTITLKGVDAPPEVYLDALQKIKSHGFINYFGTQRFGTGFVPTHVVGRAILQSKWDEVVDLLLKPRPGEKEQATRARMLWKETKDPKKTLMAMPSFLVIEKTLLKALQTSDQPLNAFSVLPVNMRLLYLHAYQSYIWNCVASKRVQQYGLSPIIGDIVGVGENFIHLDESNIGNYDIHDVVLPFPGHNIVYPKNAIFDYYVELMGADGLDPLDMKRNISLFSLPGSYRKLLTRCVSFEYSVHHYDEYTTQFKGSDLDKLLGKELPEPSGPMTAIVLEMVLESGSYATMLIREFTKTATDVTTQKELQQKLDPVAPTEEMDLEPQNDEMAAQLFTCKEEEPPTDS